MPARGDTHQEQRGRDGDGVGHADHRFQRDLYDPTTDDRKERGGDDRRAKREDVGVYRMPV